MGFVALAVAAESVLARDGRARLGSGGPTRLSAGVPAHPGAGRPARSFGGARWHHRHPRHGLDPALGFFILAPLVWHSFYYPPSYYYAPPRVWAPSGPAQYVERPDAPPASARPSGYWYYCAEPNGYYPYVAQCAGDWQLVAPQPPTE